MLIILKSMKKTSIYLYRYQLGFRICFIKSLKRSMCVNKNANRAVYVKIMTNIYCFIEQYLQMMSELID